MSVKWFEDRREREGIIRNVLRRVKGTLQLPLGRIHRMGTRNATLEFAFEQLAEKFF